MKTGDFLFAALVGVVVFWLLTGCAQLAQPVKGMCAFLPLGENESGVQFFKYECRPE